MGGLWAGTLGVALLAFLACTCSAAEGLRRAGLGEGSELREALDVEVKLERRSVNRLRSSSVATHVRTGVAPWERHPATVELPVPGWGVLVILAKPVTRTQSDGPGQVVGQWSCWELRG